MSGASSPVPETGRNAEPFPAPASGVTFVMTAPPAATQKATATSRPTTAPTPRPDFYHAMASALAEHPDPRIRALGRQAAIQAGQEQSR